MNPLYHAFLALSASSAILFGLANPALGQIDPPATIFWTGSSNSSWGLEANWNPARVPLASDHVEISTANATVNLDVSANLASLRLGQTNGTGTQTLAMTFGTTLTLATNSTVNARGLMQLASGIVNGPGLLKADGTIEWTGGTWAGKAMVGASGTLRILGNATKTLASGGFITSAGSGTWNGSGNLNASVGSGLTNNGTFTVLGDAQVLNYTGGTPVFINNGTFLKAGGTNTVFLPDNGGIAFNNNGILSVQSGVLALGGGGNGTNGTFSAVAGSRIDWTAGNVFLNGNTSFSGGGTNRVNGAALTFGGGTSTLSGGGTFEVAGGSVAGSSSFAGTGAFNWTGGSINANLSLGAGVSFNLSGSADKMLAGGVISSAGPGTWSGAGNLRVGSGSVLSNSGTFTVLGDAQVVNYTGGSSVFINNGTFLKSDGTNTVFLPDNGGMAFNNNGALSVQSGVLVLGGGGTGTNGTFTAAAGSRIDLTSGAFFWNGNLGFSGAGSTRVSGGALTFGGGTSTLSGGTFELTGGSVAGSSGFAGAGVFNWTGGSISANLSLGTGVSFNLSGSADKTLAGGVIDSAGPGAWSGTGRLQVGGSVLSNSGTFTVLGDAQVFNHTGGSAVFINNGTFLKSGGTNTTFLPDNGGMAFNNNGTVDLRSGVLALGAGYTPSPTSQLKLAIGGLAAGTQFSQLNLSGAAALAGTLSVSLSNGFTPTNGQTFTVVSGSSLTGSFSTQSLPALPAGLVWTVDQNPGSIVLRIENQQPCVSLPAGALAWWPAENSGFDLAGGNNLAFTNGVSFAVGHVGRAFSFSGNHDSAFSTSPSLTNAADSFTMEFWAYPTASHADTSESASGTQGAGGQRYAIFPEWGGSENAGAGVSVGIEGVSVFEHGESYLPSLLVYNTPISGWTHIAVVYLNKTPTLYINGAWVRTGLTSQRAHVFPSKNLSDTGDYGPYAGLLDDVAIFNRALSSNEVVAIYQAGGSGFCNTNDLPLPDLAVTGVTSPPTAFMGQAVPLVYSLSNLGRVPAPGPWVNQIVIATNTAGAAAQSIGSAIFSSEIAAGSSVTLTQSVILPAGVFGTRFLGVIADAGNNLRELSESNNTAFAATGITINAADLFVKNLSAPASAQFGQTIAVQFTVTNAGGAPAGATWEDRIYLGSSSNSWSGATLLASLPGAGPLASASAYTRTQSVTLTLTASSTASNFFILAVADAGDAQVESNEANNLAAAPISLSLPPLPDLSVPQVTAPAFALPNRDATVVWSVANSGTAAAVGEWSEVVAISNSTYGVISLADFRFTNNLDPGQFLVRTQAVAIPDTLPAGDWKILVTTDAHAEIVERSEANNTSVATNFSTVPAILTLQVPASLIEEGAVPILAMVTRNGDRSVPLILTVTNSSPANLGMTNTVTIPAGAASATFELRPLRDYIVTGNQFVVFGVTNAGYQGASWGLTVVDVDVPKLTLSFGAPSVTEGMTVPVTVSRDYATNRELVVVLNADPTQLTPPTSVVVPSNQLSYIFAVLAVDNTVVEPTRTNDLVASAAGFESATASVITLDNDLPVVTLRLAAHSISEGAGPQATVATVTRSPVSPRSLMVSLQSSDPGSAQVPASILIPGGQASVSFPIAAVDNLLVDGSRNVTLRVFVLDVSGQPIAEGSGDTLQVLDDDGPTLKLVIDRDAVPEGQSPAATATITRNTANTSALNVSLSSSATTELTVPASVVIPAGSNSVTVPLVSILDGVTDGNKSVTVTASAPSFTPGSAVIVVTDIDLPDLVVRNVTTPTNGITDANFTITYRIENRGIAASTPNFVTRVFLSPDAIPSPDDKLLGEFLFDSTLPVGQFIEQTAQFPLPGKSGRYWVIIVADAANQVLEILENNNTFVAPLPITVASAYSAMVQTDLTAAPAGTPVTMTGYAALAGGGLVPSVPVSVHITLRGTRRIVTTQTDATGRFMLTWLPLPTEAGNYQIGAAHPGEDTAPVQDSFTLIGIKLAPPTDELTVVEGHSVTGHVAAVNLGENTLSGLSASVVSAPANLSVTVTLAASSLPGDGSTDLAIGITANNGSMPRGDVRVRVTAAGGVSAEAVYPVHVSALHPHLVAVPDNLYSTMVPGHQTPVPFDLVNDGGVSTGPLTLSIPIATWLSVSSTNPLPPLPPNSTSRVTLLLTPGLDLALGPYRSSVVISDGASADVSVPFEFLNVSEGKGDLRVMAVDEFTYYAEGSPKVTNATVTIRDAVTHQSVTNGVTDAQGQMVFRGLTEANYEVEVTADKHSPFAGVTLLRGGRTNDFETFLSRETVQYHWSVVPATIEDRTRITLITEFETFVPVPVVTIEPALIDLKDFSGSVTQINLTINNHGLVAAQDFVFDLPQHPDFEFTSLVNELGPIPAMATLTVPLTIRRIGAGAQARMTASASAKAGGGPCSVSAGGCWQLACGGRKTKHCTPVAIINVGNCGSVAGGGPGGGAGGTPSWVGIPSGPGGGGISSYYPPGTPPPFTPPFTFEPPKICDCDLDTFDDKCFKIPLSSSLLNSALDALAAKVSAVKFVSDVSIKSEAKVEVCICCSKPEGIGAKISGGGSITFKGKATFPMGGFPLSKDISAGGYDFTVSGNFGCNYVQEFEAEGSVNGKTECQFKKPTVDGSLSVNLPANFSCEAKVHVVVNRNGQKVGEVDVGPIAQVSYGLSGSVKYHKDENSSSISGEICGKGLKVHIGIPVKIPGVIDTDLPYDATLVEEDCLTSPAAAAAILASADQKYETGMKNMQQMVAAQIGVPTAAAAAAAAPAAASAEAGVCAKVTIQLDQDVVMARDAFNATLELINNSPISGLSNINVTLVIQDEFGNTVNELFGLRPPVLKGLTAVDGQGAISPNGTGSASWILVPTSDAAPLGPTRYGVGGVLSYYQDGNAITIPLFPAPITVHPDPRLSVKYFHQRDVYADDPFTHDVVEPSVPFSLAVMVDNHGHGTARDVQIVSGQPRIIENEKGLLINFEIIGSDVENQPQSPSLTATMGEIVPGTNKIARWLLTSTLQGLFTDYKATFEHLDSLGKTNLSLIDEVTIHEMIHLVQAPGAFEDGRPDFLVNDVHDPDNLPDTIYLSGGTTGRVEVVRQAAHDGPPAIGNLVVHLTAAAPMAWVYFRVPEPSDGQFVLTRVVRSDNTEIYFGTNVWTTDRVFIGQGQRPIYTNLLHLLDYDSTGSYTLYYQPRPAPDTTAPASSVAALPAATYPQFSVSWNGSDGTNGSGVSSFDIFVSVDGGPFAPWLQGTPLNSSIYLGQPGHTYAFYSIATDVSGNREAAPLAAHTQTATTLTNTRPTVTLPAMITLNEGQTFSITAVATDADPDQTLTFALLPGAPAGVVLNSFNGQLTWATDEGNGPSTNQIRLTVTDNGQPSLSATGTVSVIVNEVNSAPTLEAISDRTINELQNLSIPLAAHDTDLPVQTLTFSLGAGAPRGASLNASNGVFSWTPDSTQGPSTNRIQVSVRDSGVPVLSASQTFTVIVRDSRPDFVVSFGSTNVYAGQSGQVPLNLQSGLDLTNVSLFLELNATALTNLTLSPAAAAVGSASLSPAGPQLYQIRLVPVAGEVLQGAGEFARLFFATSTNVPSALVYLKPTEVTGVRSTGDLVPNGGGVSGRIIVVNREPVLVAHDGVPHTIDIYARPGMTYTLEYSTNGTAPWLPLNALTHGADILTTIAVQTVGGNVIYQLIAP